MVVKPLIAAALIASLAATGCFTTIGGTIGSAVSSPSKKPAPGAPADDGDSNAALIGLAVGAALDIAVLYGVMKALDNINASQCGYGGCNGEY